jgi:hypothetical protein
MNELAKAFAANYNDTLFAIGVIITFILLFLGWIAFVIESDREHRRLMDSRKRDTGNT